MLYVMKYIEASDEANTGSMKLFSSKQAALAAMEHDFQASDKILGFSQMAEDDEHFVHRTEDSIHVLQGIDEYRWEVSEAIIEDLAETPYTVDFVVGDFSCDGHEKFDTYKYNSSKPVEGIRLACVKIEEVIGIAIDELCGDVGDPYLPDAVREKVLELGFDFEGNDPADQVTPDLFMHLWAFLCQQADPELKLVPAVDDTEMVNSFVPDQNGISIGSVGYGVF